MNSPIRLPTVHLAPSLFSPLPAFKAEPSPVNMPGTECVQEAFSLIEKDESKVLGIKVGDKQVTTPGQYIPKAGMLYIYSTTDRLAIELYF